jgi:uncharacterized LabA/DUF88 family protein
MLSTKTRRVGVFIDVQNMYYSARNLFERKVNFANIVKDTVGDADLIRALAYTISTKGGDEEAFFEALRKSGLEVVSKELLEYAGGNKKGDWDVGVTIDIVRMLDMLDVVVLVSGDGDFVPLAEYVKSRGRIFHVASFRESTSTALVDAADVYTNLSENKRKFLIPNRRATTATSTKKTASSSPKSKATKGRVRQKTSPEQEVSVPKGSATRNTIQRSSKAYKKPYPEDNSADEAPATDGFFEERPSSDVDEIKESRSRRLTF